MSKHEHSEHIEVHGPVRRISLPGDTMKLGERVNVFFIDRAGGILIDVGWDTAQSFAFLREALDKPPRYVLVTHLHPDHSGGLGRVLEWSNATAFAPSEDRHVVSEALPEGVHAFDDESPLHFEDETIEVLLTPGHTPGHRCFLHKSSGALFTGDMVLGKGSTWVGPPHGDMADYMRSLERLRNVGHKTLCPGHGPIQHDPVAPIDQFLAHRRDRERQVIDALAEGHRTPKSIVKRNYTDTPDYLHHLAEIVVIAHLDKLRGEGRVAEDPDGYRLL